MPGVSGCYLSAAYNGAVVAELLLPAFGQHLAELITYRLYIRSGILPYNRFILPCGVFDCGHVL